MNPAFNGVIVHQYDEVDPALLFELARNRLGDFRRFRDEIDRAAVGNDPPAADGCPPRKEDHDDGVD